MFKICNFGLIYLKRLLYACIFCVAIIFFRIVSVFTVNRKKTPKKQQQQKMIFFFTPEVKQLYMTLNDKNAENG